MSNHPDIRIEVYQRPEQGGAMVADIIDHEGLERSFSMPGGCDTASFSLTRNFTTFSIFGHLYRVKIFRRGNATPEWGGYFSHYSQVLDNPEKIQINCKGWMHMLRWRLVEDWQISGTILGAAMYTVLTTYAPADITVAVGNIKGGG